MSVEIFERAVAHVRGLPEATGQPGAPTTAQRLEFYSLFKQATEGDAQGPQPGVLAVVARAKWGAWSGKKGMSAEEARKKYVELLQGLDPAFA